MKKLLLSFLFIIISLTSNIAWTGDTTNLSNYNTCGKFLKSCDLSKTGINCIADTFWALGYISAKTYSEGIYVSKNVFSVESIKYALIKYCRDNPLKDTHDASEDIFNQLK